MRVVGGKHKGRTLIAPSGQRTRPTSGRVRETVFNILGHSINNFNVSGVSVVDIFAGTGALGFEALSRGAKLGIVNKGWVKSGAIVIVEMAAKEEIELPRQYKQLDERSYGTARVLTLKVI